MQRRGISFFWNVSSKTRGALGEGVPCAVQTCAHVRSKGNMATGAAALLLVVLMMAVGTEGWWGRERFRYDDDDDDDGKREGEGCPKVEEVEGLRVCATIRPPVWKFWDLLPVPVEYRVND
eukprot:Sspe_Gene.80548::Locus_50909_Transcript_1_1_Confidence_1.000_Length_537::g.80548::m.80548